MIDARWENYASYGPYPIRDLAQTDTLTDTYYHRNYVLKFFISSAVMLAIGGGMYAIRKLVTLKIATPAMDFADLCSVANISIFIFEPMSHGFYIHGLNPVGTSEGTVDDLKEALIKESKGNSRGRGLLPNDITGLQTYEVFIPSSLRSLFQMYQRNLETKIKVGLNNPNGLRDYPLTPDQLNNIT